MKLIREFGRVLFKNTFIRYGATPEIPATAMIGTTNLCNLNCFMCGTKNIEGPRGFMEMDVFRKIVDQCALYGISHVALHGIGEPLLHGDLIAHIIYAKNKGLHAFFSTNGQLLSAETVDRLLATRLDAIRFSIEGSDKKRYESIRRGGSFDTLLNNLKILRRKRDRRKSSLKIFVTSILMKQTASEIKEFKKLFAPLCDDIYFTHLANPGNQVAGISGDMYLRHAAPKSPCRLLWNTMVVNYDGTVSACCLDFNNRLIVGDIRKNNLKEIWHGRKYETYRMLHRQHRFEDMPLCGKCNKDINSSFELFRLNLKSRLI